jgi:hypothetical protein
MQDTSLREEVSVVTYRDNRELDRDWVFKRDSHEAAAFFLLKWSALQRDINDLGGPSGSRDIPDLLVQIGQAWASAAEYRDNEMDGEYIEALDRYIFRLCQKTADDLKYLACRTEQIVQLALDCIDEVIDEWDAMLPPIGSRY